MTAHELARKLLEGPDLMVTVRGYEVGVDEIINISEPRELSLNVYPEEDWWCGRHSHSIEFPRQVILSIHLSA